MVKAIGDGFLSGKPHGACTSFGAPGGIFHQEFDDEVRKGNVPGLAVVPDLIGLANPPHVAGGGGRCQSCQQQDGQDKVLDLLLHERMD